MNNGIVTETAFKTPACHVCGRNMLKRIVEYNTFSQVTSDCKPWRGDIHLAVCMECGSVQKVINQEWQSEVDKIYEAYTVYYQAAGAEQAVFDKNSGQAIFRSERLIQSLKSHVDLPRTGKILDVGCGNGGLLRSFAKLQPEWLLAGTELDERYRKEIENIGNDASLYTCPFEDIPGTFDLITMLHVLEHIVNPLQFLIRIKNKVKDGGFLVIDVPDYRQNPFDLLIADHSTHFTTNTLKRLLGKAGFDLLISTVEWIPKEISFVVKKNGTEENLKESNDTETGNSLYEEVVRCIQWISKFHNTAKKVSQKDDFGIFGTSIIGTWLFSEIGDYVDFFVDEDPNRIGRTHMGKPIYHPEDVPKGSNVFIALPWKVANSICQRLSHLGVTFYLPPPLEPITVVSAANCQGACVINNS